MKLQASSALRGLAAVCAALVLLAGAVLLSWGAASAAPAAGEFQSADASGFVTGAAAGGAAPALEMLGVSNVEDDGCDPGTVGALSAQAPRNILMGTDLNREPDPFVVNSVTNWVLGEPAASPSLVYCRRVSPLEAPRGNDPLPAYGAGSAGSDAVWESLPDVIAGIGQGVDYSDAPYAPAVAAALGAGGYSPEGVPCDCSTLRAAVATMHALAASADSAASDSGGDRSLRYGEAGPIALDYEMLALGAQGAVLKELNGGGVARRTVACVVGYDQQTGLYALLPTGAERPGLGSSRLLEACGSVAGNLADGLGADGAGLAWASRDQLANGADLILVERASLQVDGRAAVIDLLSADGLAPKAYWVQPGSECAGALSDPSGDSADCVLQVGRVLGCLYPEIISQADLACYGFDALYHVWDGSVADAVDVLMDGVRNWSATGDALLQWGASDAAGYDRSAVEELFGEGMAYLVGLGDLCPDALRPSEQWLAAHAGEVRYQLAPVSAADADLVSYDYRTGEEGYWAYADPSLHALYQQWFNAPASSTASEVAPIIQDEETNLEAIPLPDDPIVIGDDNRQAVSDTTTSPYSGIGMFLFDSNSDSGLTLEVGTAFAVSDHVALTAAHCVLPEADGGVDSFGPWYSNNPRVGFGHCAVISSSDAIDGPFGVSRPVRAYVPKRYYDYREGAGRWDYALLVFDAPLPGACARFALRSGGISGAFSVAGYPTGNSSPSVFFGLQYHDSGQATYSDENGLYFYDIDTEGGQSGSPLYRVDSTSGTPLAFGVHTGCRESPPSGDMENCAVSITPLIEGLVSSADAGYE